MIETWLILFLIIFIRNKFIQKLERNGVYLWKQYDINLIFKNWSFYPPIILLVLYLILEVMMLNNIIWFLEYSTIIKQLTLLSFLGLVIEYELYDSYFEKYKGNGLKAFLTSPFIFAMISLCIGLLMNYIAVINNNGHMPLFISFSYATGYADIQALTKDTFYILGDHTSKMIFLCDTIDLFGFSNLSIGDLFIILCMTTILYCSVKQINIKNNNIEKLKKFNEIQK